ncbi:hypothetical protein ACFVH6_09135 [Spirillospora sp. NPDC127200]
MGMPGFTASESLYRSRRQYRSRSGGTARSTAGAVRLQQDETEAPGTCCGKHCAGLCSCQGGHFYCSSAIESENTPDTLLPATMSAVSMAGDTCHADQPVCDSHGHCKQAWAPNCAHGCWATTHDAGCFAH